MPLAQGSSFWGLHRVFTHSRSTKESQGTETKPVSSTCFPSTRKFSYASHLFPRRTSPPGRTPRRSTSAPHDFLVKSSDPHTSFATQRSPNNQSCASEDTRSKSFSSSPSNTSADTPHSTCPKPQTPEKSSPNSIHNNSLDVSLPIPPISPKPNLYLLESPKSKSTPTKSNLVTCTIPQISITSSPQRSSTCSKTLPLDSSSPQSSYTTLSPLPQPSTCRSSPTSNHFSSISPQKSPAPPTSPRRSTPSSSPHRSSHNTSPLKSPSSPHSSPRRASTQGQRLPLTPVPPWSELMEARRRLLAVEGRRRALCALELRVQQIHCVFLQTELRVARQREGLARLVEAAGRAEVQVTVHGQRIRRALRHHKPRLLACSLCVPFAGKSERRGGQHPRRTRCSLLQGRVQALGGCVGGGGEDLGARD